MNVVVENYDKHLRNLYNNGNNINLLLNGCYGFKNFGAYSCFLDSIFIGLFAHSMSPFVRLFHPTVNQKFSENCKYAQYLFGKLLLTYNGATTIFPVSFKNKKTKDTENAMAKLIGPADSPNKKAMIRAEGMHDPGEFLDFFLPIFYRRPYIWQNKFYRELHSFNKPIHKRIEDELEGLPVNVVNIYTPGTKNLIDSPSLEYLIPRYGVIIFNNSLRSQPGMLELQGLYPEEQKEKFNVVKEITEEKNVVIDEERYERLKEELRLKIPLRLRLKSQKGILYYLFAVIAFAPYDYSHYITYLRDEDISKNQWYQYNDMDINQRITDTIFRYEDIKDYIELNGVIYIYYSLKLPELYKSLDELENFPAYI